MRNIKILLLFGIVCTTLFCQAVPQDNRDSSKNTEISWFMLMSSKIDLPEMDQLKFTNLSEVDKFLLVNVWFPKPHDYGRVYSPT